MQKDHPYAGQLIEFLSGNPKPEDKKLLAKFEQEKDLHFIKEDGCLS